MKQVTVEMSTCAQCPWFVPHPLDAYGDWCNRLGRIIGKDTSIPDDCPLEDATDEQ